MDSRLIMRYGEKCELRGYGYIRLFSFPGRNDMSKLSQIFFVHVGEELIGSYLIKQIDENSLLDIQRIWINKNEDDIKKKGPRRSWEEQESCWNEGG